MESRLVSIGAALCAIAALAACPRTRPTASSLQTVRLAANVRPTAPASVASVAFSIRAPLARGGVVVVGRSADEALVEHDHRLGLVRVGEAVRWAAAKLDRSLFAAHRGARGWIAQPPSSSVFFVSDQLRPGRAVGAEVRLLGALRGRVFALDDEERLVASDGASPFSRLANAPARPVTNVALCEGAVALVTADGSLFVSADHGERWRDASDRTRPAIAVRCGADGRAYVATPNGLFSVDADGTLAPSSSFVAPTARRAAIDDAIDAIRLALLGERDVGVMGGDALRLEDGSLLAIVGDRVRRFGPSARTPDAGGASLGASLEPCALAGDVSSVWLRCREPDRLWRSTDGGRSFGGISPTIAARVLTASSAQFVERFGSALSDNPCASTDPPSSRCHFDARNATFRALTIESSSNVLDVHNVGVIVRANDNATRYTWIRRADGRAISLPCGEAVTGAEPPQFAADGSIFALVVRDGRHVLRAFDAEGSFDDRPMPERTSAVTFADGSHGVAVIDDRYFLTRNGGRTWSDLGRRARNDGVFFCDRMGCALGGYHATYGWGEPEAVPPLAVDVLPPPRVRRDGGVVLQWPRFRCTPAHATPRRASRSAQTFEPANTALTIDRRADWGRFYASFDVAEDRTRRARAEWSLVDSGRPAAVATDATSMRAEIDGAASDTRLLAITPSVAIVQYEDRSRSTAWIFAAGQPIREDTVTAPSYRAPFTEEGLRLRGAIAAPDGGAVTVAVAEHDSSAFHTARALASRVDSRGHVVRARTFSATASVLVWPARRGSTAGVVVIERSRFDAARFVSLDGDGVPSVALSLSDARVHLCARAAPRDAVIARVFGGDLATPYHADRADSLEPIITVEWSPSGALCIRSIDLDLRSSERANDHDTSTVTALRDGRLRSVRFSGNERREAMCVPRRTADPFDNDPSPEDRPDL